MLPVPVLSYSAINSYKTCPQKYYRSYIDPERKLNKPQSDLTGTLPGHVVHKLVERACVRTTDEHKSVVEFKETKFLDNRLFYALFKSEAEDPRISFKPRSPDFHLGWADSEKEALDFIRECRDNLILLLKTYGFFKPFVLNEWWFGHYKKPLVFNDQLKVSGALDWFAADSPKDVGILADFKGSNSDFRLDPDQLLLYQAALEANGFTVGMSAFLMFKIRGRKPAYHGFKRSDIEAGKDKFVQISKKIQAEEFDYSPSESACFLCDFRDVCPKAVKVSKDIVPTPGKQSGEHTAPSWEIPEL
ncbi:PD-(D/E)XK nuclease family protein [Candidatus Parcubacteria bacterium]|nr:PD-(D/E)XK nuclease family protein [Candidatus Parcubacteria bacterium]